VTIDAIAPKPRRSLSAYRGSPWRCPALYVDLSRRALGQSRWITAGSSAAPEEYAVNAASIASMH
jgi:hypothetical protein